MTDKQLIHQLNNLKEIKPDNSWKNSNRDILYTQISNSVGDKKVGVFTQTVNSLKDFLNLISQPAIATVSFAAILLVGVFVGHGFLKDAQPDNSLYIARIISEKAQLNMTFNKEQRQKMEMRFATEHAKDISSVLSSPEFNKNTENENKIVELNESFRKEIDTIKRGLEDMEWEEGQEANEQTSVARLSEPQTNEQEDSQSSETTEENQTIFSVENNRDTQGIDIQEKDEEETGEILPPSTESPKELATTSEEETTASSTQDKESTQAIVEEAEKSFEDEDYDKTGDKLIEFEEILNSQSSEKTSEGSTSTEE